MSMIALTVAEIMDLAAFAGLNLAGDGQPDGDDLETEIVISDCPPEGVLDDEGRATHWAHIATLADYPEEGCMPLGAEVKPNADLGRQPMLHKTAEAP